MSWFDTTGFANLAKTALKEAQKTIDKALDIKDDDMHRNVGAQTAASPVDVSNEDFFSSWGITSSSNAIVNKEADSSVIIKSPIKAATKLNDMTNSLWGSFTGSFFDNSSDKTFQHTTSVESLGTDDSGLNDEKFSRSKLVVREISDDGESLQRASTSEVDLEEKELFPKATTDASVDSAAVKRRERPNSFCTNRLSVISSESGKNSSESVEVLSCTTPDDSEVNSLSKPTSESVEVISDSLTSPSSVEVLNSDATNSHRLSQITDDEFASPLQSPVDNKESDFKPFKLSPDSVEIIPETGEEEDDSISYLSISESTDATVFEPGFNSSKFDLSRSKFSNKDMVDSISSDLSLSPDKYGPEPIVQPPSRSAIHLPLALAATKQLGPNLLEAVKIIDIPSLESSSTSQPESNDEGSQSDRTLIADGESVGIESGSDESNTNSSYLKHMIADAMIEKSQELALDVVDVVPGRDQSPISSESRSDLVKIGSEQTSGHTSGDELETTTSSDIEIISSPNGDNSSVQSGSRQSPAKLQKSKYPTEHGTTIELLFGKSKGKIKGHNRELSETSSHSDDSHSSEIDRLLKRVSEMTEILEVREAKLIDTTRRNAELQEFNNELKQQLESILSKQIDPTDLNVVTEEYTQRLSALEKKFQQAIREKDILRKQLEHAKQDAATRMSKSEMETVINEKDEVIKELRQEGEKLSKQQLQHSNIIKKLRTKEKENETAIKHFKERAEELTSETDHLKRSLTAKEEVERFQIDAVHQLTSKNKKLENETTQLKSQLDDTNEKLDTFKKSLDAAKKELNENNRTNSELQVKQQAYESLENEKRRTQLQNEEVINQLEDLRQKLRNAEQDYLRKEQALRKENVNLLRRVEDAETRNEELAQSVSNATKPLIRQLEMLQATHTMKLNAWENQEQDLIQKLKGAQEKLISITERERNSREECITLRSTISSLESKYNNVMQQIELVTTQFEQQKAENTLLQQQIAREKNSFTSQLKSCELEIEELKNEIISLKSQLAEELKKSQIQELVESSSSVFQQYLPAETRTTSPTLSLRRLSFSESLTSSAWQPDDHMDASSTGRYTNVFEIESLQSTLKQKDGELQQLQWELTRRDNERTYLTTEVSNLTIKHENLEQKLLEHNALAEHFNDLQQKYDAMCQMYGEKVEETLELRLDLLDVKEMYKSQIDELLKQNKNQ